MTRIVRGKIELRRVTLDLVELGRRVAADYAPLAEDRGVALIAELPTAPILVEGDATRLSQVLGNLLSNAKKFTPRGGRVTLAIARRGDRAIVEVRDTGIGVAQALLPRMFEPFVQAQQTLARSEGGLGLGLALVKWLVELHGGEVTATSAGEGVGTTFTVVLPAR